MLVQKGVKNLNSRPRVMLIAEISGNHLGSLTRAKTLIEAAANSGATHVKLQTYTPDTLTIRSDNPDFIVSENHPLWGNQSLYDLYEKAQTPWKWHQELFQLADNLGMGYFSTPFDSTAVDFLESLNVKLYKIASLETGDLNLIARIAKTGKPILMSTGATTMDELDEAVNLIRSISKAELTLLLCTSAYPTELGGVHLRKLDTLSNRFNCKIGLSDHTLSLEASLGAVAKGATVIERHLTLSRTDEGPDAAFSLEPHEFKQLSTRIADMSEALGSDVWENNPDEDESRRFRRSLYVVKDVHIGELVNPENVRSIRPANGLHPRYFNSVMSLKFTNNVKAGQPLRITDLEQPN